MNLSALTKLKTTYFKQYLFVWLAFIYSIQVYAGGGDLSATEIPSTELENSDHTRNSVPQLVPSNNLLNESLDDPQTNGAYESCSAPQTASLSSVEGADGSYNYNLTLLLSLTPETLTREIFILLKHWLILNTSEVAQISGVEEDKINKLE